MKITLLTCLLSQFIFTIALSQIAPSFPNVNYCGDNISKHLLDIFIPPSKSGLLPLVVHIHGGTFVAGQKGQALPQPGGPYYPPFTFCDSLYSNQYVIADINYRLASDSIFPALIYDIKTAIRFLKINSSLYHIDSCKIGIIGESTGGHLAAFLGTSIGVDSLEGKHLGSTQATSNVQAVMDLFGPTDFNYFDGYYPHTLPDSCNPYPLNGNNDPGSPTAKILGCTVTVCPEKVKAINPITYVDGNEPPFRIYHGTFDCAVPFIQSKLLNEAILSHGEYSLLTLIPHTHHNDSYFYTAAFKDSIRQFFDNKLKNDSSYCKAALSESKNSKTSYLEFRLYPNPSSDYFALDFINLKSKNSMIRIFDFNGRCIEKQILNQENAETHIEFGNQLTAGFYFINLIDGRTNITRSFAKIK